LYRKRLNSQGILRFRKEESIHLPFVFPAQRISHAMALIARQCPTHRIAILKSAWLIRRPLLVIQTVHNLRVAGIGIKRTEGVDEQAVGYVSRGALHASQCEHG